MFSARTNPDKLAPGDHLCVRRLGLVYSHHGIYAGEGRVIHYTDVEGLLNKRHSKVVETPLDEFLGTGRLRRRTHARPSSPEEILKRARTAMDQSEYHLVFNNCEHFATWCATGRKYSPQVQRAAAAVASVVTMAAAAAFSRGSRRPRT